MNRFTYAFQSRFFIQAGIIVGVVRLNVRVYIYAAPSFYGPWLWRESEESAPQGAVQQQDLLRREELLSFLHAVVQHRER